MCQPDSSSAWSHPQLRIGVLKRIPEGECSKKSGNGDPLSMHVSAAQLPQFRHSVRWHFSCCTYPLLLLRTFPCHSMF